MKKKKYFFGNYNQIESLNKEIQFYTNNKKAKAKTKKHFKKIVIGKIKMNIYSRVQEMKKSEKNYFFFEEIFSRFSN